MLAVIGAVAALAVVAPVGQANFTTGKCQGSNITGRGASFANSAHAGWKTVFETEFCADVGTFPTVTYEPQGSGAGRRVMGERTAPNADGSLSRNQVPRFGMTDEPPTPTAVSQMNQGTDAAGDEGTIHVIPGAVGSVVLAVNFPDNCDRSLLPDSAETNPAAANAAPFNDRVRFTRTQAEEIWNGDSAHDQWVEIFPTLAGDADCNVFITRVVRFDDSGTTFAFKTFFDSVNPTRNWDPGFTTGPDTRNWPNASLGPRADCAGTPTGPQGAHLTSGCANGNGPLLAKLNATDGGVGYSDIGTGRANAFDITPAASAGARDDDRFWTQTTNSLGQFVEATHDPNAFQTTGVHGANCEGTTFTGVPASTLGDWQNTLGVDSTTGWVICTLTYGLVFDDYKGPYSLQGAGDAAEEQKARSVKDYWEAVVSDAGQESLFANDYAQLPGNILNIARNGVNAVCWDKSGTGQCPTRFYAYPRPKGATPVRVSLVPAFNQCTAPNRTHGPALAFPSCNPPVKSSASLTVGSPDANGAAANFSGFVKYEAIIGAPGGADDSDLSITIGMSDVHNSAGLGDYTGQVQVTGGLRITDRVNGQVEAQPGTVQDTTFPITVGCTTTVSTTVGSDCNLSTTADAVVPGSVPEGKRSVWELGQVTVNDGGADGVVSTGPNTVFAKQGVFIP